MELKITAVQDFGTLESERVEISVIEDCNLKFFIVADTTFVNEHEISNKLRHMYWFMPQEVVTGDKIHLYTRVGKNATRELSNGKTLYILYWGLRHSVWNNEGDAAVLFSLDGWKTTKVE